MGKLKKNKQKYVEKQLSNEYEVQEALEKKFDSNPTPIVDSEGFSNNKSLEDQEESDNVSEVKHKKSKKKKKLAIPLEEIKELSNEYEVQEALKKKIDSNPTPSVDSEGFSNKRSLEDQEDSDNDSEVKHKKPKKKKKLAIPLEEETKETGKKTKKSIRQMKKERHAQRLADAASIAKDNLKSQCLNYLSQWKHDRQNWKFMKVKQVWLYKNKFSKQLLPENSWPLLLEYFESAQGNIRKMLLDDAHKIIKQMDDWTELQNQDDENEINSSKPDDIIYNRARSIIQCLQD